MAENAMQSFGPYQLIDRIGSGGMGEIFLARLVREQGFEKYLVIKRILPHLSKASDFVAMFNNEARIAAQLAHQNICQIYDFGKVDRTYYIAMEYIRGHDLRTLIDKATTIPYQHAFGIAIECLKALEYAHNLSDISGKPLGLIHRDVSPQNIMVTYTSGVKLMDFGLAKAAHLDSVSSGMIKGNFGYMSPEQVSGAKVGPRSDLFNLGAVLYEMLSGRTLYSPSLPFEKLVAAVSRAEFPSLDKLGAACPPGLVVVADRALAADPARRYASAAEMSYAIEQALSALPALPNNERLGDVLERHLGPAPTMEMPAQVFGGTVVSENPIRSTGEHQPVSGEAVTIAPGSAETNAAKTMRANPRLKRAIWPWALLAALGLVVFLGGWRFLWQPMTLTAARPIPAVSQARIPSVLTLRPNLAREGTLELKVTPLTSVVTVDGIRAAGPPYRLSLKSGEHALHVSEKGFDAHQTKVTIRGGATLLYNVTLIKHKPKPIAVTLNTEPTGASVSIGGVLLPGATPLTVQRSRGRYPLTVRLKGFQTLDTTLLVAGDKPQRLLWKLVPVRYQLRIGPRRLEFKPGRSSASPLTFSSKGIFVAVRWSATKNGVRFRLDTRPFSSVTIGAFRGVTPVTQPQFVGLGRRRLVTLKSQGKVVRFTVGVTPVQSLRSTK